MISKDNFSVNMNWFVLEFNWSVLLYFYLIYLYPHLIGASYVLILRIFFSIKKT